VPPDFASLKLAPGFLINLSVLDDPDFEGNFRVDQDGNVALPVLGVMHIAGETASDARQQIAKRLADDQILKDPQVNLTIIEYTAQEVTILGEVYSPGRYQLLAPRSLTDVLGLAGGLTVAAGNEIVISHGDKDTAPTAIHFSKATGAEVVHDTVIHPGDTVQVKRAGIVYVLGAVYRPGGYVMQEDGTLTVLEAIAMANGTTLPASVSTIDLIRRNPDGTAIRVQVPLGKMQRGKQADMRLQATDILYVPNSKLKEFFTNAQGAINAAATASIYAATIY
jgi:polysaccharide export outer membrane protein